MPLKLLRLLALPLLLRVAPLAVMLALVFELPLALPEPLPLLLSSGLPEPEELPLPSAALPLLPVMLRVPELLPVREAPPGRLAELLPLLLTLEE